ncbi:MAG: sigma-54 dependent transcriptional regulator [Chitinophagaceae bacterium]
MVPAKILIVDDEEQLRKLLNRVIALEGYDVIEAANIKAAKSILSTRQPELVLCDVKLPDGNGVDFVKFIRYAYPQCEVILITAYGNISDGVRAIKNGAFDYIVKGDDNDRIIPLLAQALQKQQAGVQNAVRVNQQPLRSFTDLAGKSDAFKKVLSLAQKIAGTDTTVLLLGETGTGKEVFANAIHYNSKRRDKNFVAINCSSFSRDLLESELFGYKAGAYTGALKDKKGLIEVADGGTLFLDEIGEMNIDLQAKLLRVLENGEFIKLGDIKSSKVDVRIIAATNRHLVKEIESGHFREDLYYRLNVFNIELPPLRERKEDIAALAIDFAGTIASRLGRSDIQLTREAIKLLEAHAWKGNIRELRNVIERAVIISDGPEIMAADLPFDIQKQQAQTDSLSLASVEKNHIGRVLKHTQGNKTEAARLLDIGLTTLYRKIEEYGIGQGS